jgi:hypothetical protein
MDTDLTYATDKNKLYNVMGMARWGVRTPTGILFESMDLAGGEFLAFETQIEYPILFDVAAAGRYPTSAEWTSWNSSVYKHPAYK